jgi:hypothetical protein
MTDARSTDEASEWCRKARELLGKQRAKKLSLKSSLTQAKEANDKFDKRLRQLGELNGPEQQRQQAVYRRLAGELQALSQANDQAGMKTKLGELDALQLVVEAEIKKAKDLTEAMAKFEKAYAEREIEVSKTRGLRGATLPGSSVHKPLQQAVVELADARRLGSAAWTGRDPTQLVPAHEKLKAVGTKLAEARDGVKNVKAESQADLAAQGEWMSKLPLARQALVELRKLPGAEAACTWMQKLIDDAVALLVVEGGVTHGYKAALDKIADYAAVAATGRKESEAFLAKDKPVEVVQALARVTACLPSYEVVAPSFALEAVRQEAQELAERGRRDAPTAVALLDKLAKRVQDDTTEGGKEMAAATDAQTAVEELITALESRQVPETLLAASQRAAKLVDDGDFAARQWVAAKAGYERAARQLKVIDDGYKAHGTAWEAKRNTLAEIATLAQQATSFPALQHLAMFMLDACAELKKPFDRFDFEASLTAFEQPCVFISGSDGKSVKVKIADAHAELKRRIAAGNTPVGDPALRKAFDEALQSAHREVLDAQTAAGERVRIFLDGQQGLTGAQRDTLSRDASAGLSGIVGQWQKTAAGLSGDPQVLAAALDTALKALRKLADDLEALALSGLKRQVQKIRFEKAKANDEGAPERMAQLLARLKERGIDVAAEERLVEAQKDAPRKAYGDIFNALQAKEEARNELERRKREKLLGELQNEVRGPLQELLISAGYKKELERAGRDVRDLVNTEDMDLADVAQAMKDRLKAHIQKIDETPELHEQNKKDLDALGARIGKLLETLPATSRRLQTRHIEELAESKRCAPMALKARIAILAQEVAEGEQALKDRETAVKEYKAQKAESLRVYASLKDEAGKGDAFNTWFEARIAEASALKNTEGGIPDAMKLHKELQARIAQMRGAGNPRAAMAEQNSLEQQHHRLMLDLSRQWQQELATFLTDTLEQARAALARSGEADDSTIRGLKDLANGAGQQLAPYLKNLDTPGIGALSGPDVKKMKADFERARQTLATARSTAQRLLAGPESTNVQGPSKDGLTRLRKKWSERTRAYSAAIGNVARAVGDAAASETDDGLKKKALAAAQMITELATMFHAEAFSAAFGVLLRDANGDAGIERARLAARETVLRQMRQYRADLESPLLRKLASKANPIDATSMTVALGGLGTTLKEIELQALDL